MPRRLAFLFVWAFIAVSFAVIRPVVAQNAPAAPVQVKPDDQTKPSEQTKPDTQTPDTQGKDTQGKDAQNKTGQSKPGDSNVFVLKAPEMPAQQQMVAQ